jgi:hypothetical protein
MSEVLLWDEGVPPVEGCPAQLVLRQVDFITQSKVVAQLTLLVAISVLHRSCPVAAEALHR